MSGFRAGDGFVHFVYADGSDCYLLPSLVRLDLERYLYWLLKEQGYEAVFFLSGTQESYSLRWYDAAAAELYRKYGRKSKGLMGLFGADGDEQEDRASLSGAGETLRRLQTMLKKGTNQAFVLTGETFRELARKQPEELEELRRSGERELEKDKNILVLCLPLPQEQPQPDCRTQVLNTFTLERMRTVARRIYLTGRQDLDWDTEEVERLAVFLHAWYESEDLRSLTGPLLSENEGRSFSLLLDELGQEQRIQQLTAAIEQLRQQAGQEPLERYLERTYCSPAEAPTTDL